MEIGNEVWKHLKELIEDTAPGVSITIHFRKGTQDETVDGSSYDDDFWSIRGSVMKTKAEKYSVVDGYLSEELIKLAKNKIKEKGMDW